MLDYKTTGFGPHIPFGNQREKKEQRREEDYAETDDEYINKKIEEKEENCIENYDFHLNSLKYT